MNSNWLKRKDSVLRDLKKSQRETEIRIHKWEQEGEAKKVVGLRVHQEEFSKVAS